MKAFQERNPVIIGAIGVVAIGAVGFGVLNYDKLPLVSSQKSYSAYFAEAGGLTSGAAVQVSGFQIGKVQSISLDGPRVLVRFNVDSDVSLGDRTEAAVKTKSLLGTKVLDITPRGDGQQDGVIPLERTTSAYQLPDAIGDITAQISGLNTDQLSDSLSTLADTFRDTPEDLRVAVDGVARFSEALNRRDDQLRQLLANANKATTVLGERSDKIVQLIRDTNALLVALQAQSAALDQISDNITALATQIKGFIADNRGTLKPALDKLNGALTIVDNRKAEVQQSIKGFTSYVFSLGESVSSGPFFKAYLSNLLPGQYIQPFVDAAFSDLGLDPNVLAPSERTDPQTGQPGTPALPVPFPRTGQGGEPRLTIPDAITGNPGDQQCGPPGLALPGPGCYPYRDPGPQPAPGGPPPGPPAAAAPGQQSTPEPTPGPVYQPAPGEIGPDGNPVASGGTQP
ncbi:MCE family protein [Mycobacterium sp. ITM-2016-00316]|uniref:MCE family protein n=1 Tax=Mycobacterium sp. ITM-2016-00316 TaxID=2099695 RepID=UPI000CF9E0E9|nr:MCE family protein [Mycobacterium sp. ITM-2016-00316]WNG83512.1 MCE family protein [Mycobacterium sp. ITM-2016-00316]